MIFKDLHHICTVQPVTGLRKVCLHYPPLSFLVLFNGRANSLRCGARSVCQRSFQMELRLSVYVDIITMLLDKQFLFGENPDPKQAGYLPDLEKAGASSAGQLLLSMEVSLSWLRDWLVSSKFRSSWSSESGSVAMIPKYWFLLQCLQQELWRLLDETEITSLPLIEALPFLSDFPQILPYLYLSRHHTSLSPFNIITPPPCQEHWHVRFFRTTWYQNTIRSLYQPFQWVFAWPQLCIE